MKKAESVKEIFQNFLPGHTLSVEDKDFYVELFEEEMLRFSIDLEDLPLPNKTYLIAGQTGNGKSTALNMLSINYPNVNKKYDFKYVMGREAFQYIENIDIADVLFNIAYSIIKENKTIQDIFIEKLTELEKIHNEELIKKAQTATTEEAKAQINAKIGIGAKILSLFESRVDFTANYKMNEEARNSAIEIFKFKKQELTKIVNEIIFEYEKETNKKIIVVIDDLEKRDDVNHLFTKEYQLPILNNLNIIKIITMPVHLKRTQNIQFGEFKEFGLKIKNFDGSDDEDGIRLLKEVINRRLEDKNLITQNAINEAITYSGANMNQLISLIHKAALKARTTDSNKINQDDVIDAVKHLRKDLSSYVMNQKKFLSTINKNEFDLEDNTDNVEKLQKAIANEVIFAYFNGHTWYSINPVCLESLEVYNK